MAVRRKPVAAKRLAYPQVVTAVYLSHLRWPVAQSAPGDQHFDDAIGNAGLQERFPARNCSGARDDEVNVQLFSSIDDRAPNSCSRLYQKGSVANPFWRAKSTPSWQTFTASVYAGSSSLGSLEASAPIVLHHSAHSRSSGGLAVDWLPHCEDVCVLRREEPACVFDSHPRLVGSVEGDEDRISVRVESRRSGAELAAESLGVPA